MGDIHSSGYWRCKLSAVKVGGPLGLERARVSLKFLTPQPTRRIHRRHLELLPFFPSLTLRCCFQDALGSFVHPRVHFIL